MHTFIYINVYILYTRILVYYNSVCFIQYDLALNILNVLPWNRWDPLYAWCPLPSGDRLRKKYIKNLDQSSCWNKFDGIHNSCSIQTQFRQRVLLQSDKWNSPCSPLSAVCAPRPLEQRIMLKDTAQHARLANYKSLWIDHHHTQKSVFSQSSLNIYVVQKRRHITSATSDQHGRFHLISHVRTYHLKGKLIGTVRQLRPWTWIHFSAPCHISHIITSKCKPQGFGGFVSISFQSKLELTDPILIDMD